MVDTLFYAHIATHLFSKFFFFLLCFAHLWFPFLFICVLFCFVFISYRYINFKSMKFSSRYRYTCMEKRKIRQTHSHIHILSHKISHLHLIISLNIGKQWEWIQKILLLWGEKNSFPNGFCFTNGIKLQRIFLRNDFGVSFAFALVISCFLSGSYTHPQSFVAMHR